MGTINIPNSGIGGGGFAVVRLANGATRSFNFREMAPQAAHENMFAGKTPLTPVSIPHLDTFFFLLNPLTPKYGPWGHIL